MKQDARGEVDGLIESMAELAAGSIGDGDGVWRPAGLPQADRRAERPPPILDSRNDDPRLRDMALETAPWRPILNADRRASVLIGACTSGTVQVT